MTKEESLIESFLDKAQYEGIKDLEPYYGEIPGIQGVWATGMTLEDCRWNLGEALKDWLEFKPTA